jgi:hypothetical protein
VRKGRGLRVGCNGEGLMVVCKEEGSKVGKADYHISAYNHGTKSNIS